MIKIEGLTAKSFSLVSFNIDSGLTYKIFTNTNDDTWLLVDILLAIKKPIDGKVLFFDRDIHSVSEKVRMDIFKRIGVIRKAGGIISNLKVWENILLPVWYHYGKSIENVEERIVEIFKELGWDESSISAFMGKLPGPLGTYEKRLIKLASVILMDPDLVIYESIFEELKPDIIKKLISFTSKFHSEKKGRASIYIGVQEEAMKDIKADLVYKQHGYDFKLIEQ